MKLTRLLSAAALALVGGVGLVVPAAPSAEALGSWPVVPFQIQDKTGNCLSRPTTFGEPPGGLYADRHRQTGLPPALRVPHPGRSLPEQAAGCTERNDEVGDPSSRTKPGERCGGRDGHEIFRLRGARIFTTNPAPRRIIRKQPVPFIVIDRLDPYTFCHACLPV